MNVGSSSLKLSVLDEADRVLARRDGGFAGESGELKAGFEQILGEAPAVAAAGHRVVHGGHRFSEPLPIDAEAEADLAALADLAPLHNPPAVAAIEALRRLRPELPSVACFDTAFHATIPPAASTYAIPPAWSAPIPLRRYGFHGLSHAYASRRAAELLERDPASLRLVTAHLGAGASLAAVRGGRSVDTTMGFTPLEGLVMATRSGSVDPGLLLWVQRHSGRDPAQMESELDRGSGLLALCGHADMREVIAGADSGEERCSLALQVYLHRLAAGVAAMAAAMGGIDALVFTGGIGEHSGRVRVEVSERLGFLGLDLDPAANGAAEDDAVLSPAEARVSAVVVTAREDIEIARQVRSATSRSRPMGAA
ncbi:MAG TPA: acetate/propionate family kinase [Solirubrobacterales bacterium]|nr:acetate/propionate family kinase [Solirubrobacterales bacterium]